MKKDNTSRKAKRISIRRHLPIGVRVHYDVVRNFAPIKLVGLSVMVMIAVFGILLATQTVSPGSEASATWTGTDIQYRNYDWGFTKPGGQDEEYWHRDYLDDNFKVSTQQNNRTLKVLISVPPDVASSELPSGFFGEDRSIDYSIEDVKAQPVSSSSACTKAAFIRTLSDRGTPIPWVTLPNETLSSIDLATTDNNQYYCFQVKLKGDISWDSDTHPEWIFVTRNSISASTSSVSTPVTPPNFTVSGVSQTGLEVSFVVASSSSLTPTSVKFSKSTSTTRTCPTLSVSYTHNATLASTYPGGAGRVYRVPVLTGSKNICVKIAYSQNGSGVYEVHGPFPVNTSSTPLITIIKSGREYSATASNVRADSWKHVVVSSSSACVESSFVHQGAQLQGVQTGSSYTVADSVGTTQNGKYVCFRVQGTNSVWSYRSTAINVPAITTTTTTTIVTPTVEVALSPGSIATRPFYTARDTAGNAASANTWHHIVVSSSSACKSSAFILPPADRDLQKSGSSWRPTGQEITDYQGKYICFRARNSAGTDFGHMRIDLSSPLSTSRKPVVVVDSVRSGSSTTYVARNTNGDVEVSSWVYVFVSSSVSCNGLSFLKPNTLEYHDDVRTGNIWTPTAAQQTTPPNTYICFSGSSSDNQIGFGYKLINVTTTTTTVPDPVVPPEPTRQEETADATLEEEVVVILEEEDEVVVALEEEATVDTAVEEQEVADGTVDTVAGVDKDGEDDSLIKTGALDSGHWSQLAGYILIGAALLGIVRILIVKKYKRIG